MDPNNMTGEPSQNPNHPSVFNFDPYPPTFPVDWNQANPFARTVPVAPQFGPLGEYSRQLNPREIGNAFSLPHNNILSSNVQGPQNVILDNPGFPVQQQGISGSSTQPNPLNVENSTAHSSWTQFSQTTCNFSFGTSKPGPDVIQFPFQIDHGFGQRPFRCKRKTDSPPLQPAKQHITEEKMAEHMSRLHISSETIEAKETETGRIQRLYMCEEMRKLQADSIIPPSLLTKINQPCKALVLWKPPARLLPAEINNEVDENENNNAERVPNRENDMESEMDNDNISTMDMDS